MIDKVKRARSGVERQRDYRANRRSVSIDIAEPTALRIRELRQMLGIKTDELLMRSVHALERALAAGGRGKRAKPSKQSGKSSLTPASIPLPGDKNDAGPIASSNAMGGERRVVPRVRTANDKTGLSPQGKLDF
jgi:hypothetical protein